MKIRKLNSLRAFAAIIVLISHYSNESKLWSGMFGTASGQFGVMIFFLLSAFLMSIKYIDAAPVARSIANYAVARMARVIPLYLFVVMVSFSGKILLPSSSTFFLYQIDDLNTLIAHLLFLKGVSVLWTVIPEIHFYILFIFVWVATHRLRGALNGIMATRSNLFLVWLVVACFFFAINSFVILWKGGGAVLTIFGVQLALNLKVFPYFAMGGLLGGLYNRWQPSAIFYNNNTTAFALMAIALIYPLWIVYINGQGHLVWADFGVFLSVSVLFFIIIFIVPAGNVFFSNQVADFFGKISYSLYLMHFPVLLFLKELGYVDGVVGFIMYFASSTALAYLTFVCVETPFRVLIRSQLTR